MVRIGRAAALAVLVAIFLAEPAACFSNLPPKTGSYPGSRHPFAGAARRLAPGGMGLSPGGSSLASSLQRGPQRVASAAGEVSMLGFAGTLPAAAPLLSGLLQAGLTRSAQLAPMCGTAIGLALVLSAYPALRRQKALGELGDINPLPYPAMLGNAMSWLMYGFEIANFWVIGPNLFNILAGAYYTKSGLKLAEGDDRLTIFKTLASYAGLFTVVHAGLRSGLIQMSQRVTFGLMANFCLLFFYAAPLATLSEVIRTKDASSIDPLLAACGMINGFFWFVYGWGVRDVFIWLPNIMGFALNALTAAVRAQYGEGAEPEEPVPVVDVPVVDVKEAVRGSFTLVRQMSSKLLEKERRYHVMQEHQRNMEQYGRAAIVMAK